MTRKHTSCSTGDSDGDGDGDGDGNGDDDGDGEGDGDVNQDHIVQKKLPYYYTARAKLQTERGVKKWPPITFKTLKRTRN